MKYYPVSLDEMKLFLNTHGQWDEVNEASTKEHVFDTKVPGFDHCVVRVFSSIHKDTAEARRKGKDAIRVCSVNIRDRKGWIKSVRCLRVQGWKDNLHHAIVNVTREAVTRCERSEGRSYQTPPPAKKVYPRIDAGLPFTHEHANVRSEENNKLANQIWLKHDDGTYSAEASTLDANKDRRPRNLCPKCDHPYAKKDLTKIDWADGTHEDIGGWNFKCPGCGTRILVIND